MSGKDLLKHDGLKVFKQHGFRPKGISGNQVVGYSIFSEKDSMYINPETKAWDCKVTGNSGGFKRWLSAVLDYCRNNFSGRPVSALVKDRGISRMSLNYHRVGYNPVTDKYVIPILSADKNDIFDMKIYDMNASNKKMKFIGTTGCSVGLFGWDTLNEHHGRVWICEGEWDKLAFWDMLKKIDNHDDTVVAVPGGMTFKSEWHSLFKDRKVIVVYDKDLTGIRGQNKVNKSIAMLASDLKFIHWPESRPDGFDFRDFFIKRKNNPTLMYQTLIKNYAQTQPIPVPEEQKTAQEKEEEKEEIKLDGEFVSPRTVYREYRKWLHLPDTTVIDVLFGSIIANRLQGDPLWLFIVAPSGATKTEFLMSISDAPLITTTTSLTPHTLISGANFGGGSDPSLIPKLDGRILIIKDFTTLLNMNQTAREEIMGIFRDAYDGKTEKMFGTGITRSYKSKFGIIAGVTPAIELFVEGQTALGERFLRYKIPMPSKTIDKIKYLQRALDNSNSEIDMRKYIREIGCKVLSHDYGQEVPEIPKEIQNKLIFLAQWVANMRGTVERDKFTKEMRHKPFIELGTRLVKQFTKLLYGITLFRGKESVSDKEFVIVRDIAISSVPTLLENIVHSIYKNGASKEYDKVSISNITGNQQEICRRAIEDLCALKMLKKEKKTGLKWIYSMSEDCIELIKEGKIYG